MIVTRKAAERFVAAAKAALPPGGAKVARQSATGQTHACTIVFDETYGQLAHQGQEDLANERRSRIGAPAIGFGGQKRIEIRSEACVLQLACQGDVES